MTSDMIAFCGLYCGACSLKLAADECDKDHLMRMPQKYDYLKMKPLEFCPGCRLENQCGQCSIRDCAMEKGIDYCSLCDEFPCETLVKFNNDGIPHHGAAIENLNKLVDMGAESWVASQVKEWTCGCGAKYSWYKKNCGKCNGGSQK